MFITDINTSYDKTVGSEEKFAELTAVANSSINTIESTTRDTTSKVIGGKSSKISSTDALDFLVKGAFGAMKTISGVLELAFKAPIIIANALNIPPIFTSILYIIIVTGIIWGLIYLILRVWPKMSYNLTAVGNGTEGVSSMLQLVNAELMLGILGFFYYYLLLL